MEMFEEKQIDFLATKRKKKFKNDKLKNFIQHKNIVVTYK